MNRRCFICACSVSLRPKTKCLRDLSRLNDPANRPARRVASVASRNTSSNAWNFPSWFGFMLGISAPPLREIASNDILTTDGLYLDRINIFQLKEYHTHTCNSLVFCSSLFFCCCQFVHFSLIPVIHAGGGGVVREVIGRNIFFP